jgi:hypothetical protein
MAGLSDPGSMQVFVNEFGLGFPQTISEDGDLWTRFSVPFQGSWVFLNDDGTAEVVLSDLEADALRAKLDELLTR